MNESEAFFDKPIDEMRWLNSRELLLTVACVVFTCISCAFTALDQWSVLKQEFQRGDYSGLGCHVLFLVLAALLVYGGLVYQLARLNYVRRMRSKSEAALEPPAAPFPVVSVLIPSFKEEEKTIYQTMMSAALQAGIQKRIILLIDNPPDSKLPEDVALLKVARTMPQRLEAELSPVVQEMERFEYQWSRCTSDAERNEVWVAAFNHCGNWFASRATAMLNQAQPDHTDRFFAVEVLLDRAYDCWRRAEQGSAGDARDLVWLRSHFEAEIEVFERKKYANLSQAMNKAANLNGYLSLMGGVWREEEVAGQLVLTPAEQSSDVDIDSAGYVMAKDSPFVLSLDADSLLLPDYASILMRELLAPGNERIAVVQTPYSAIPGPDAALERVAGATTDVQYIIHQGFTSWNATYWVGANALMRKEALEDIAEAFQERGYTMKRYIQDRTVIEDTESTIDLLRRDWTLYNHPARLSYSATPADFGSLLIQRRRWANGGLLVLPKACTYLSRIRGWWALTKESFMRIHYLVSITTVNIGLAVMLAFPLTDSMKSFWLPLTAIPYFFLYGRDLRLMGYKGLDVFRVYALNLLLIPVNLGGVFKSIEQAVRKRKIPFSRTPKVGNRTPVLTGYIVATLAFLTQWVYGSILDFNKGYVGHGLFSAANALILAYAIIAFIGLRYAVTDLVVRKHPN